MSLPKFTSKTIFELILLSILSVQSSSTAEIIDKTKNLGFNVPKGSLYPLLAKLTQDKNIISGLEEMDDGSIQKTYSLTKNGTARFKELKTLWRTLERIIFKAAKISP